MVVKVISILLMLSCILDLRAASYTLTISPEYTRVTEAANKVVVTCSADAALTRCQFSWWEYNGSAGPLLELSRGKEAHAHFAHLNDAMTGYGYSGRGLVSGDCGVTLEVKGDKRWMVACRVQAATGGWKYAWGDLHARNKNLVHSVPTPREVVLLPGNPTLIRIKANESLSRCNFFLPGAADKIGFKAGENDLTDSRPDYRGEGLKSGDCGLALDDVGMTNNGPVLFWISNTAGDGDYSRFVAIVVAQPPIAPVMSVVTVGDDVTATCVVQGSRPIANISWLLGDDVIRQDLDDDSPSDPQDGWRWPWMQGSISQRLKFTLKPEQHGKTVKCRVTHIALGEPLEVAERVGSIVPTTTATPVHSTSKTKSVDEAACKECPRSNELSELLLRDARARASISEVAEETAKRSLEAAKCRAKDSEARAKELDAKGSVLQLALETAQFNVRVEEAMATNAEEELEYQRERRKRGEHQPQSGRNGRDHLRSYTGGN